MNGQKLAAYKAAASFALPGAVMAAFASGYYIVSFAAFAAAAFLSGLYGFRTTASMLSLSALLVFIDIRHALLQTVIVGALLIPIIALTAGLPVTGNTEERSTDIHSGTKLFLTYQLAGLFLASLTAVTASWILASQIGFRINNLILIIPVAGVSLLLIIFAAEGIRGLDG